MTARTIRNAAAMVSLAVLGIGLWWLSPPWCLVVLGVLGLTAAIVGMIRNGGERDV